MRLLRATTMASWQARKGFSRFEKEVLLLLLLGLLSQCRSCLQTGLSLLSAPSIAFSPRPRNLLTLNSVRLDQSHHRKISHPCSKPDFSKPFDYGLPVPCHLLRTLRDRESREHPFPSAKTKLRSKGGMWLGPGPTGDATGFWLTSRAFCSRLALAHIC